MIGDAEASEEFGIPGFAPSQLHDLSGPPAADHWTIHEYRVVVREVSEALTAHWRECLGRADVDGTKLWQQTLSGGESTPGWPKLVWRDPVEDKHGQEDACQLVPTCEILNDLSLDDLALRNVTTRSRVELSDQEGMERLAAYSYLTRLLDGCEMRTHEGGL
ncbi:TIGR02391 family protein [Streptomyces sp. WMMB 714]|uniref:TIGR02391 family protein n=1 Tax=Streptomyces sp. WMMB 714 TaxID=1286822 RepID=UPI00131CAD84|nr:TIGR02391 family protein [Streptomyces sp. WMMB 714]